MIPTGTAIGPPHRRGAPRWRAAGPASGPAAAPRAGVWSAPLGPRPRSRRTPETAVLRVLLVEDSAADARLVGELLRCEARPRFEVTVVARLAEAVRTVERERCFDVVLLDLSLPDAAGLDGIERLHEVAPQIPIIVLTGLDDEDMAVNAVHAGAQDYLLKSGIDARLLVRAIRYAIERKLTEETLAWLAHYDALTGAANRALFRDRLEHAVTRARRDNAPMAVVYLDLDHFKWVNDSLGHDAGDDLLRQLVDRIRACVRESDTIARLGGDEFTVIVEGLETPDAAQEVARKLHDAAKPPFRIDGHEVTSGVSIGVAVFPQAGEDAETLLKSADASMYEAKQSGRGGVGDVAVAAGRHVSVEDELRGALERDEFVLEYQPRVDMASGRIVAAEALLRWNSRRLGRVPPARFIPVAEDTGLIVAIGEWVLRTACRDCLRWQRACPTPVGVAVNLSARQFRRADFPRAVLAILEETGLDPALLDLEITETMLMVNTDASRTALVALKRQGVRVAIDDFGTGYSSLSYLKRFPLDRLKIDQSFVRDIANDSNDAAIVEAVIALAHSLRLEVVAEGVETEAQHRFLQARRCESAQGFLFSAALGSAALEGLLRGRDAPPEAASGR